VRRGTAEHDLDVLVAAVRGDGPIPGWPRAEAARTLVELGDLRAVGPLISALAEVDSWLLGDEIVRVLGQLGSKRAIKPIRRAREAQHTSNKRALEALALLGDRAALTELRERLTDRDFPTRIATGEVLADLAPRLALEPALRSALTTALAEDEDDRVRIYAARALGATGGVDAIDPLIGSLQDESDVVGRVSAAALTRLGEPAVAHLIAELEQAAYAAKRQRAAAALKAVFTPRERVAGDRPESLPALGSLALPALCGALDDPDALVRSLATEALRAIAGHPAMGPAAESAQRALAAADARRRDSPESESPGVESHVTEPDEQHKEATQMSANPSAIEDQMRMLQGSISARQEELHNVTDTLAAAAHRVGQRAIASRVALVFLGALVATRETANQIFGGDTLGVVVLFTLAGLVIAVIAGLEAAFKWENNAAELRTLAATCQSTLRQVDSQWQKQIGTAPSDERRIDAARQLLDVQDSKLAEVQQQAARFGVNITLAVRDGIELDSDRAPRRQYLA
jgi:HEAT repeat protein